MDLNNLSPFFKTKGFATKGYQPIVSSITGLFGLGNPSAIFFVIPFVVVDAVKLQSFYVTVLHVANKVANVMPMLANCDAPASITMITYIIIMVATVHHGLPNIIKWVVGFPMLSYFVYMQTTTTAHRESFLSQLTAKFNGADNGFIATLAKTLSKCNLAIRIFVSRENSKPFVLLLGLNRLQRPVYKHGLSSYKLMDISYQVYG